MPQFTDLVLDSVTVRFGGLIAVDGVSLEAKAGRTTGLIGPNGAGKTTTFNACTGTVATSSGRIRLGDFQLDGHSTAVRAARGLGRTFQRMELFNSMTVQENVSLGVEAVLSSRRPWGQLVSGRREKDQIKSAASDAIDRCTLGPLANRVVGQLSTGQKRLVELARAIASPFTILLLDEPSSGLDPNETAAFGRILKNFVSETGKGILLVEHDMDLVSTVCEYVYVLDFGRLIFSGSMQETLASDVVKAAYLGGDTDELAPRIDDSRPYDGGGGAHA